jgi:hypothetical protein
MSIASNKSAAFFPDCNIFATPIDSTCTEVETFNKTNRAVIELTPKNRLKEKAPRVTEEVHEVLSFGHFDTQCCHRSFAV